MPNHHTETKPNVAVALHYDQGQSAVPRVTAIGKGHLAERIVQEAEAAGVHVERDVALAEALANVKIEQAIPADLFKAVAAVLGFLMRHGKLKGAPTRPALPKAQANNLAPALSGNPKRGFSGN